MRGSGTIRAGLWMCALATSLLVAGCAGPPEQADITLKLPEPSPPLVDVVLLLDQSGSMNGPNGTDPHGVRVEAARYLVANVSEKSAEDDPNRIAIVDFGDDVVPDVAQLAPVTPSQGYDKTARLIGIRSMGGTNVLGALKAAVAGLNAVSAPNEGRKGRVVLFTDGKPEDDRGLSTQAYFAEIASLVEKGLVPHDYQLYIIAVDQKGEIWSQCAASWKSIAGAEHVVRIHSVNELRGKFNQVVNQIFSIPDVPPDVLTRGRHTFSVKPYLDRVEFHVFPATAEMKLQVLRPDGSPVRPDADRDCRQRLFKGYYIVSVFDPPAGEWTYEVLEGKGNIEVYRNEVPLRMELVLPEPVHAQGKLMQLVASFARHSGKPVTSEVGYPLGLSAQVLGPTGNPVNVQFDDPAHGLYYGEPAVPTELPGLYRLTLRVQAGTVFDTSTEYTIKVGPEPYLEVERPRVVGLPFMQQYLAVEGTLKRSGKATSAEESFSNHPNLLYLAQVNRLPGGADSATHWLTQTDGRFSTRFPLPMSRWLLVQRPLPGQCIVHLEHAGTPVGGGTAPNHDVSMQVVSIAATPWATVLRIAIAIVLAHLLAVVASWLNIAVHIARAHRMQVALAISHARTGEALASFRSMGRTWASVRTKPWVDKSAPKGKPAARVGRRFFVFWGIDRQGARIGGACVAWGLAIPFGIRKGQPRSFGQIRVQA